MKDIQNIITNIATTKTINLLKRFDCKTIDEIEQINRREYGSDHFDITTIKLIVETLLVSSLEAGLSMKTVSDLGKREIERYPTKKALTRKMREYYNWKANRTIHNTPKPRWIEEKTERYWNLSRILERASQYKTKTAFKKAEPKAYTKCVDRGWLDKLKYAPKKKKKKK